MNGNGMKLVPGTGRVMLFEPAEGKVERFVYDGDPFERVSDVPTPPSL